MRSIVSVVRLSALIEIFVQSCCMCCNACHVTTLLLMMRIEP